MSTPYSRLRSTARSWWGDIQWSRTLAPGVLAVTTGGHGGILVDPSVFPLRPELRDGLDGYLARWTFTRTGEEAHRVVGFEEDCGWAALLDLHPELVGPAIRKGYLSDGSLGEGHIREHAASSARYSYPKLYGLDCLTCGHGPDRHKPACEGWQEHRPMARCECIAYIKRPVS